MEEEEGEEVEEVKEEEEEKEKDERTFSAKSSQLKEKCIAKKLVFPIHVKKIFSRLLGQFIFVENGMNLFQALKFNF